MTCVAVVIPCYREAIDRVARTVESARAVSNVNRIVVVDDGCANLELDGIGVDVVRLADNRGCSAALNAGIESLPDDAIACRLDVGDEFFADAKARQIDVVLSGTARCSSSPHFDPVSGETWIVPARWRHDIYRDSVFTGCTNVYRKDVWLQVGGHDESLRYCGDWDFSMKVQHAVGWHMHDEATCSAGMFPDGFSARSEGIPRLKKLRADNRTEVTLRGRILSHPDAYKHLRDPGWCRKRGLVPRK